MKYKDKNGLYIELSKKNGKYVMTYSKSPKEIPFFGIIVNGKRKEEFKNLVNLYNMKEVKETAKRIAEETTNSVNKIIAENLIKSGNETELVKDYILKLKTNREEVLNELSASTVAMLQKSAIYMRKVRYKGEVLQPFSRGDLFMKIAERVNQ